MSLVSQVAWHAAVIGGGIVVGALLIPGFVYLMAKSLPRAFRGVLGRILWTIGAIINGRNVLDQTADGRYVVRAAEEAPPDVDADWIIHRDGAAVGIRGPDGRWSRLGKQPFTMTWEKVASAVEPWGSVSQARADGGSNRAGSITVDLSRVMDHFGEAGDIRTLQRARRVAQRKFSGDGSLSTKWLIIAVLIAAVGGGLTGLGLVVLM